MPMTTALSVLMLGEQIGWRRGLGIALAVSGVMMVMWDPGGLDISTGLLFVAGGAFCGALGTVLMKRLEGVRPLRYQAWVGFSSVILLAAMTAAFEFGQLTSSIEAGWPFVALVLFSGLVVSVFGHSAYYGLVQRYEANLIAPLTLISPLMAIGLGIWLTNDHFDMRMAFGSGDRACRRADHRGTPQLFAAEIDPFPEPRLMLKLSVLDQAPISEGSTGAEALKNSVDLAQLCDRLGYLRYWVAEHHGTPMLACASPEALIGPIAATTSAIRVGSGGVMLPHYSPLKVAETFSMFAGLFPGRIDLGLGRAPGQRPEDRLRAAARPPPRHAGRLSRPACRADRLSSRIRCRRIIPTATSPTCPAFRTRLRPISSARPCRAPSGPASSACPMSSRISSIPTARPSPTAIAASSRHPSGWPNRRPSSRCGRSPPRPRRRPSGSRPAIAWRCGSSCRAR